MGWGESPYRGLKNTTSQNPFPEGFHAIKQTGHDLSKFLQDFGSQGLGLSFGFRVYGFRLLRKNLHIYIYIYTYMYMNIAKIKPTCKNKYVCVYIYMRIYMYICMNIDVHT